MSKHKTGNLNKIDGLYQYQYLACDIIVLQNGPKEKLGKVYTNLSISFPTTECEYMIICVQNSVLANNLLSLLERAL